jgi:hypothetical protein
MGPSHLNFLSKIVNQVIHQEMSKKTLLTDSACENVLEGSSVLPRDISSMA